MSAAFIASPESFSTMICQPGNEVLEFATEQDVLTTSVVYFVAAKIHSAAVVAIPAGIAILSLIGLIVGLRKRMNILLIAIAFFLFIFFAGMIWLFLSADPILLGFGIPSVVRWMALLSAAGSFFFAAGATKRLD
jgi:hypothetical protein